eukprot:NODE_344_length_9080_cov_0.340051.p1 type:complete len:421 gc:universal NODE_344_length_9080_cov_0.340051:4390-3128(-)
MTQLKYITASHNNFDAFENNWGGNTVMDVDVSHNKIRGVVDMSGYKGSFYNTFNFRDNWIDRILTANPIELSSCDVSLNNIIQNDLTNLTSCVHDIQKYTDPVKLQTCSYIQRMFQKMAFDFSFIDENCCDSNLGYLTCINQNVTNINIYLNVILHTIKDYAFSVADLPPTLQSLYIRSIYNQTAKLPFGIPGSIKSIEIHGSIRSPLPVFAEGLETLIIADTNLNQPWPVLPSTLKVLRLTNCNLTGPITNLPPNLQELQIQGNLLTGPFPTFPASLKIVILGDLRDENNSFNDVLVLQSPTRVVLGKSNVYDLKINSTSLLTNCDLSFNPLLNSTTISNYTMCKKYYLNYLPAKLQIAQTTTQISKTTNIELVTKVTQSTLESTQLFASSESTATTIFTESSYLSSETLNNDRSSNSL